MQRLEVSGAVRPIYGSLGFKRLKKNLSLRASFFKILVNAILHRRTHIFSPHLELPVRNREKVRVQGAKNVRTSPVLLNSYKIHLSMTSLVV